MSMTYSKRVVGLFFIFLILSSEAIRVEETISSTRNRIQVRAKTRTAERAREVKKGQIRRNSQGILQHANVAVHARATTKTKALLEQARNKLYNTVGETLETRDFGITLVSLVVAVVAVVSTYVVDQYNYKNSFLLQKIEQQGEIDAKAIIRENCAMLRETYTSLLFQYEHACDEISLMKELLSELADESKKRLEEKLKKGYNLLKEGRENLFRIQSAFGENGQLCSGEVPNPEPIPNVMDGRKKEKSSRKNLGTSTIKIDETQNDEGEAQVDEQGKIEDDSKSTKLEDVRLEVEEEEEEDEGKKTHQKDDFIGSPIEDDSYFANIELIIMGGKTRETYEPTWYQRFCPVGTVLSVVGKKYKNTFGCYEARRILGNYCSRETEDYMVDAEGLGKKVSWLVNRNEAGIDDIDNVASGNRVRLQETSADDDPQIAALLDSGNAKTADQVGALYDNREKEIQKLKKYPMAHQYLLEKWQKSFSQQVKKRTDKCKFDPMDAKWASEKLEFFKKGLTYKKKDLSDAKTKGRDVYDHEERTVGSFFREIGEMKSLRMNGPAFVTGYVYVTWSGSSAIQSKYFASVSVGELTLQLESSNINRKDDLIELDFEDICQPSDGDIIEEFKLDVNKETLPGRLTKVIEDKRCEKKMIIDTTIETVKKEQKKEITKDNSMICMALVGNKEDGKGLGLCVNDSDSFNRWKEAITDICTKMNIVIKKKEKKQKNEKLTEEDKKEIFMLVAHPPTKNGKRGYTYKGLKSTAKSSAKYGVATGAAALLVGAGTIATTAATGGTVLIAAGIALGAGAVLGAYKKFSSYKNSCRKSPPKITKDMELQYSSSYYDSTDSRRLDQYIQMRSSARTFHGNASFQCKKGLCEATSLAPETKFQYRIANRFDMFNAVTRKGEVTKSKSGESVVLLLTNISISWHTDEIYLGKNWRDNVIDLFFLENNIGVEAFDKDKGCLAFFVNKESKSEEEKQNLKKLLKIFCTSDPDFSAKKWTEALENAKNAWESDSIESKSETVEYKRLLEKQINGEMRDLNEKFTKSKKRTKYWVTIKDTIEPAWGDEIFVHPLNDKYRPKLRSLLNQIMSQTMNRAKRTGQRPSDCPESCECPVYSSPYTHTGLNHSRGGFVRYVYVQCSSWKKREDMLPMKLKTVEYYASTPPPREEAPLFQFEMRHWTRKNVAHSGNLGKTIKRLNNDPDFANFITMTKKCNIDRLKEVLKILWRVREKTKGLELEDLAVQWIPLLLGMGNNREKPYELFLKPEIDKFLANINILDEAKDQVHVNIKNVDGCSGANVAHVLGQVAIQQRMIQSYFHNSAANSHEEELQIFHKSHGNMSVHTTRAVLAEAASSQMSSISGCVAGEIWHPIFGKCFKFCKRNKKGAVASTLFGDGNQSSENVARNADGTSARASQRSTKRKVGTAIKATISGAVIGVAIGFAVLSTGGFAIGPIAGAAVGLGTQTKKSTLAELAEKCVAIPVDRIRGDRGCPRGRRLVKPSNRSCRDICKSIFFDHPSCFLHMPESVPKMRNDFVREKFTSDFMYYKNLVMGSTKLYLLGASVYHQAIVKETKQMVADASNASGGAIPDATNSEITDEIMQNFQESPVVDLVEWFTGKVTDPNTVLVQEGESLTFQNGNEVFDKLTGTVAWVFLVVNAIIILKNLIAGIAGVFHARRERSYALRKTIEKTKLIRYNFCSILMSHKPDFEKSRAKLNEIIDTMIQMKKDKMDLGIKTKDELESPSKKKTHFSDEMTQKISLMFEKQCQSSGKGDSEVELTACLGEVQTFLAGLKKTSKSSVQQMESAAAKFLSRFDKRVEMAKDVLRTKRKNCEERFPFRSQRYSVRGIKRKEPITDIRVGYYHDDQDRRSSEMKRKTSNENDWTLEQKWYDWIEKTRAKSEEALEPVLMVSEREYVKENDEVVASWESGTGWPDDTNVLIGRNARAADVKNDLVSAHALVPGFPKPLRFGKNMRQIFMVNRDPGVGLPITSLEQHSHRRFKSKETGAKDSDYSQLSRYSEPSSLDLDFKTRIESTSGLQPVGLVASQDSGMCSPDDYTCLKFQELYHSATPEDTVRAGGFVDLNYICDLNAGAGKQEWITFNFFGESKDDQGVSIHGRRSQFLVADTSVLSPPITELTMFEKKDKDTLIAEGFQELPNSMLMQCNLNLPIPDLTLTEWIGGSNRYMNDNYIYYKRDWHLRKNSNQVQHDIRLINEIIERKKSSETKWHKLDLGDENDFTSVVSLGEGAEDECKGIDGGKPELVPWYDECHVLVHSPALTRKNVILTIKPTVDEKERVSNLYARGDVLFQHFSLAKGVVVETPAPDVQTITLILVEGEFQVGHPVEHIYLSMRGNLRENPDFMEYLDVMRRKDGIPTIDDIPRIVEEKWGSLFLNSNIGKNSTEKNRGIVTRVQISKNGALHNLGVQKKSKKDDSKSMNDFYQPLLIGKMRKVIDVGKAQIITEYIGSIGIQLKEGGRRSDLAGRCIASGYGTLTKSKRADQDDEVLNFTYTGAVAEFSSTEHFAYHLSAPDEETIREKKCEHLSAELGQLRFLRVNTYENSTTFLEPGQPSLEERLTDYQHCVSNYISDYHVSEIWPVKEEESIEKYLESMDTPEVAANLCLKSLRYCSLEGGYPLDPTWTLFQYLEGHPCKDTFVEAISANQVAARVAARTQAENGTWSTTASDYADHTALFSEEQLIEESQKLFGSKPTKAENELLEQLNKNNCFHSDHNSIDIIEFSKILDPAPKKGYHIRQTCLKQEEKELRKKFKEQECEKIEGIVISVNEPGDIIVVKMQKQSDQFKLVDKENEEKKFGKFEFAEDENDKKWNKFIGNPVPVFIQERGHAPIPADSLRSMLVLPDGYGTKKLNIDLNTDLHQIGSFHNGFLTGLGLQTIQYHNSSDNYKIIYQYGFYRKNGLEFGTSHFNFKTDKRMTKSIYRKLRNVQSREQGDIQERVPEILVYQGHFADMSHKRQEIWPKIDIYTPEKKSKDNANLTEHEKSNSVRINYPSGVGKLFYLRGTDQHKYKIYEGQFGLWYPLGIGKYYDHNSNLVFKGLIDFDYQEEECIKMKPLFGGFLNFEEKSLQRIIEVNLGQDKPSDKHNVLLDNIFDNVLDNIPKTVKELTELYFEDKLEWNKVKCYSKFLLPSGLFIQNRLKVLVQVTEKLDGGDNDTFKDQIAAFKAKLENDISSKDEVKKLTLNILSIWDALQSQKLNNEIDYELPDDVDTPGLYRFSSLDDIVNEFEELIIKMLEHYCVYEGDQDLSKSSWPSSIGFWVENQYERIESEDLRAVSTAADCLERGIGKNLDSFEATSCKLPFKRLSHQLMGEEYMRPYHFVSGKVSSHLYDNPKRLLKTHKDFHTFFQRENGTADFFVGKHSGCRYQNELARVFSLGHSTQQQLDNFKSSALSSGPSKRKEEIEEKRKKKKLALSKRIEDLVKVLQEQQNEDKIPEIPKETTGIKDKEKLALHIWNGGSFDPKYLIKTDRDSVVGYLTFCESLEKATENIVMVPPMDVAELLCSNFSCLKSLNDNDTIFEIQFDFKLHARLNYFEEKVQELDDLSETLKDKDQSSIEFVKRIMRDASVQGWTETMRFLLEFTNDTTFIDLANDPIAVEGISDCCPFNEDGTAGNRALHFAAGSCHADAVKVLLNYGADLSLLNENGFTPPEYAISHGCFDEEIQQLLPLSAPVDFFKERENEALKLQSDLASLSKNADSGKVSLREIDEMLHAAVGMALSPIGDDSSESDSSSSISSPSPQTKRVDKSSSIMNQPRLGESTESELMRKLFKSALQSIHENTKEADSDFFLEYKAKGEELSFQSRTDVSKLQEKLQENGKIIDGIVEIDEGKWRSKQKREIGRELGYLRRAREGALRFAVKQEMWDLVLEIAMSDKYLRVNGKTPLHIFAEAGKFNEVTILLGLDETTADCMQEYFRSLESSARSNRCSSILREAETLARSISSDGETPFFSALKKCKSSDERSCAKVIVALAVFQEPSSSMISARSNEDCGRSALLYNLREKRKEYDLFSQLFPLVGTTKILLRKGSWVDTLEKCKKKEDNRTPLMLAVELTEDHERWDIVNELLNANADPNVVENDLENGTPNALSFAVTNNDVAVVAALLKAKADPTRKNLDNENCSKSNNKVIKELCKNAEKTNAGATALVKDVAGADYVTMAEQYFTLRKVYLKLKKKSEKKVYSRDDPEKKTRKAKENSFEALQKWYDAVHSGHLEKGTKIPKNAKKKLQEALISVCSDAKKAQASATKKLNKFDKKSHVKKKKGFFGRVGSAIKSGAKAIFGTLTGRNKRIFERESVKKKESIDDQKQWCKISRESWLSQ
eukprot:g2657.t1